MARTGFLSHAAFLDHDPGRGHPERPARLRAIQERLVLSGLRDELAGVEPRAASEEEIARIHPAAHVTRVREVCHGPEGMLDWDTLVSEGSWDAARRAAGAGLEAVDRVVAGEWRNAFCALRPPGHHAERARAMGFCLFNNAAVAAAALREVHGLERVAILDWDVHHGNGTQHLFEKDPTVLYASLHQWPHYPGTGAADERGVDEGEGFTTNCPLAAGSGDAEWLRALEGEVLPALEAFRPQFLLLSAGFDAHRLDPLSETAVTVEGFATMTRRVVELADACCAGRVVSLLEGGYDPSALARSVQAHVEVLVEDAR